MSEKMDRDIRRVLKSILEYVGADVSYAKYAQLQTWLKNLILRNRGTQNDSE